MDFFDQTDNNAHRSAADLKPLADRMRPRTFDEFVGQEKIVGDGTPLRKAVEADRVGSLIFWGPPGSGKTTLAEIIARSTRGQFVPFSAVTSGIKEVKEVLTKAVNYYQMSGRRTYVFIDEIHRFNKAQQDAFLPYVEKGEVVLIGATTENPSFEVNSALLSRMRVLVLERLSVQNMMEVLRRALTDSERGLGARSHAISDEAMEFLASAADGDARRGLTLLEQASEFVGNGNELTLDALRKVHQKSALVYDKTGEEHYNIISALHKTIRGGDPDAALYWLARMLAAGEDPRYVIRRLVRFASEDVGMADPYALTFALNVRETYHFLGSPEGELAIAQLVIYLACAPKSNSVYLAFGKAMADAEQSGSLPVPLTIRNAPTALMKGLGYGKDYKYAHEFEDAITDQEYFPEGLEGSRYYFPKEAGREQKISDYLRTYLERRRQLMARPGQPDRPKKGSGH
ncbi:MAG: replication-associated recombination protein A [candidate division Zixibacteria bacterium]|jgi:putative ATPase|nr:replication-associated recombination protein A [candidate division Zixibacteria bacterium]